MWLSKMMEQAIEIQLLATMPPLPPMMFQIHYLKKCQNLK